MHNGAILITTLSLVALTAEAQQYTWRLATGTNGYLVRDVEPCLSNPDSVYALVDSAGPKLLLSTDRGEHWRLRLRERGSSVAAGSIKPEARNSSVVYLSYGCENLRGNISTTGEMTTDGGSTWLSLGTNENFVGAPSAAERTPRSPHVIYLGIGFGFVGGTGFGQVKRTRDQGQHWDTLFVPGGGPEAMAIAPSDTNTMYQGYSGVVYRSTDGGHSWGPAVPVRPWISSLAIHPHDERTVYFAHRGYFGNSGGVFKSTDGGATWSALNTGMIDSSRDVNAIAVNSRDPEEVFIAGYPTLCYRSTNGGERWVRFDLGLPSGVRAWSITVDTLTNRLYLGTSTGIYVNDIATSVGSAPSQYPPYTVLDQNYPNPFNPKTEIRFGLPRNELVSLAVYNILGQRIAVLASGFHAAGSYTVSWNGGSAASGVYIYRLEAGRYTKSRTMLLLR